MEHELEMKGRPGVLELEGDDLVQAGLAVEVEVACPLLKVHAEQQPHKPKVMVPMKVADKYLVDLLDGDGKPFQLRLCPFPTVDEDMVLVDVKVLCGRKPSIGGQRTAGPQYGKLKGHGLGQQ